MGSQVKFQSTLPRGERHSEINIKVCIIYFNPRSREGSDMTFRLWIWATIHFNPRSREGSDVST